LLGDASIMASSSLQLSYTSPLFLAAWVVPWSVAVAVFIAAAVRALTLRRVITASLRRNQALGIGLLAAAMAWFCLVLVLPIPSSWTTGTLGDILFIFEPILPFVVFFYWVDSSILASRRVDPLFRDTLAWSRVRKFVWGLIAFCLGAMVIGGIILADILGVSAANTSIPPLSIVVLIPLAAPFVGGLILLPLASKRSGDPAIKHHLRWFAYFVGSLGLGVALVVLTPIVPLWPGLWIVAGYCLYRSVSSLVVVSRLPLSTDSTTTTQLTGAS